MSEGEETHDTLQALSYKALQALAKKRGVKANLSKGLLIEHLLAAKCAPNPSNAPAVSTNPPKDPQYEPHKPQEDVMGVEEDVVVPPAEVVAEAPVNEDPPQKPASLTSTATEVPERRKSGRLSAMPKETTEQSVAGTTSREAKACSTFVTKRPAVGASNRFDRAHQNMFAAQQSIEGYAAKTPKKGSVDKENMTTGQPSVSKGTASKSKAVAKAARAPVATPARSAVLAFGSGVKAGTRGMTVASKPCTLVVQRSKKKPTQVQEFRLSSNTNRRERFTFKPYSGPVRPITPALAPLADKTPNINGGCDKTSHTSHQGPHTSSKAATHRRQPVKAKTDLAASKAQAARRRTHQQSGKTQRAKKIVEGRVTRS